MVCCACNIGFHAYCVTPALIEVPKTIYFCRSCLSAGSSINSFFGEIPGTAVGFAYRSRSELSASYIHTPTNDSISGSTKKGCYSLVITGRYNEIEDYGEEIIFTGSSPPDYAQKLIGGILAMYFVVNHAGNASLAQNCPAHKSCAYCSTKKACSTCLGLWRSGPPVRVVRSSRLLETKYSTYAPKNGFRYDGLYKVVDYWSEIGHSGSFVWRFRLRRDDPTPPPWAEDSARKMDQVSETVRQRQLLPVIDEKRSEVQNMASQRKRITHTKGAASTKPGRCTHKVSRKVKRLYDNSSSDSSSSSSSSSSSKL